MTLLAETQHEFVTFKNYKSAEEDQENYGVMLKKEKERQI